MEGFIPVLSANALPFYPDSLNELGLNVSLHTHSLIRNLFKNHKIYIFDSDLVWRMQIMTF